MHMASNDWMNSMYLWLYCSDIIHSVHKQIHSAYISKLSYKTVTMEIICNLC